MDWLGSFFTIAGLVLNTKKNPLCWPLWILSDLFWLSYFLSPAKFSVPGLILQAVFITLNCVGWYSWTRPKKE
jgi:nicotinamide riboside transporter PnuC